MYKCLRCDKLMSGNVLLTVNNEMYCKECLIEIINEWQEIKELKNHNQNLSDERRLAK